MAGGQDLIRGSFPTPDIRSRLGRDGTGEATGRTSPCWLAESSRVVRDGSGSGPAAIGAPGAMLEMPLQAFVLAENRRP